MAVQPLRILRVDSFRGLVTNADPHDLPNGALREQNNLACLAPGQLTVRKGMVKGRFANAITATTHTVLSLTEFRRPDSNFIVYFDTGGALKAGRGLTQATTNSAGAPSIRTGLNTFERPCFMKTPQGHLIVVNGIGRGTFLNCTAQNSGFLLGIPRPPAAPRCNCHGRRRRR